MARRAKPHWSEQLFTALAAIGFAILFWFAYAATVVFWRSI